MRVGAWLALFGLIVSSIVSPAYAQRVLVVRPPTDDATLFEAFGRLKAELALQGFEIVVESGVRGPMDPDVLEIAASREEAFAAISLQREEDGTTAEVHIVDRVTGKTITRKLIISSAKDGPMLLAIRAADLLRTSLLELGPGERPPEDVVGVEESPPPDEVVRFSRSLPRFQIAAGGMATFEPVLGLSAGVTFSGNFRPVPRLQIGFEFVGPAFGGEYHAKGGSATVRQEWGLLRSFWNFGPINPGPRFEWGPTLGAGLVHVDARGEVEPPLVAQRETLSAFGALGGVQIESYFSETVSLGLSLAALGLIPQPVVAVHTERSAPIGVQGVSTLRFGVSF